MNLPQLPVDKANHFVYGAAMAVFAFVVSKMTGTTTKQAIGLGMGFCSALALAKELIYDKKMGKGTPDPNDFIATVAGGAMSVIPAVIAISQ